MTMYLEQLASWNEFSLGLLSILQLRAGMQGNILYGTEFLLAACLATPAPYSRKGISSGYFPWTLPVHTESMHTMH